MRIEVRLTCDRDGFRAWCPALPGCSVRRESRERALNAIHNAIVGYLASLDRAISCDIEEIVDGQPAEIGGEPVDSEMLADVATQASSRGWQDSTVPCDSDDCLPAGCSAWRL